MYYIFLKVLVTMDFNNWYSKISLFMFYYF